MSETVGTLLRINVIPILLFCGLLILFAPGLFQSKVPGFRDTYHFYYPQAVWLDACRDNGEYFPTWNHTEGLGVSVTGQASSALYYPLRIIWYAPGSTVAQRLSLFILVHLLIGYSGIYLVARKLGTERQGAQLAGVCYSLSCPVFFQHCNLIYLTSAAWIGFALAALITLCRRNTASKLGTVTMLVMSSSMMMLGGDAHTCVNTFLVCGLAISTRSIDIAIATLRRARQGRIALQVQPERGNAGYSQPNATIPNRSTSGGRFLLSRLAWLSIAVCLTLGLTAIQWGPMRNWVEHTNRLSSIPSQRYASADMQLNALLKEVATIEVGASHTYDFSLSPWHLSTYVFPMLGGHYLPANSRWFDALSAEGRMWIPSLYFGFLPCLIVAGVVAVRLRKWIGCGHKDPNRHWAHPEATRYLLGLLLLSLLASFGNYSVVWFTKELLAGVGCSDLAHSLPPDPIGSVYWIIANALPGYDSFRYPAKWTVWLAACTSLLAGLHLESLHASDQARLTRWMLLLVTTCLLLGFTINLFFAVRLEQIVIPWFATNATDDWLGRPMFSAVVQTLLLAISLPIVVWFSWRSTGGSLQAMRVITTVELLIVCSHWLTFVEAPVWQSKAYSPSQSVYWSKTAGADILSDNWIGQNRANDIASYQEQFLLGKLGALTGDCSLHATQSLTPAFLVRLKRYLAGLDDMGSEQPKLDQVLSKLGVTHRLVRRRIPQQRSSFDWQAISDPSPLCTYAETGENPARGNLSWEWQRADTLLIETDCTQATTIVVRQFNDGNWLTDSEYAVIGTHMSHPLVEISIPAGSHRFHLCR